MAHTDPKHYSQFFFSFHTSNNMLLAQFSYYVHSSITQNQCWTVGSIFIFNRSWMFGPYKLQSSEVAIFSSISNNLWIDFENSGLVCRVRAAADFWPSSSSRSRVIDLSKSLMWACQDLRSQSRVIRDVSPSIRKISQDQENWCKNFHSPVSCSQCILWPSFLDLFILQNWIALGLDNFQDLNFWLQIH